MKNKLSGKKIIYIFWVSIIFAGQLLSQEVVLERTLPPGWIFNNFYYQNHQNPGLGMKALFLVQDLPEEIRAGGKVARRLQVFDAANNLVADLTLPEWHWFGGFIGNDRLLVYAGDVEVERVEVLDFKGNEIYSLDGGGRQLQQSLLGNDFALTPRLGLETGPISIIDGEKGKEKLKIEPYPKSPPGWPLPGCFLLIGDGYFLTGLGATLFLENYNQPGQKLWMIRDIGGNIQEARILSKDLIAVSYDIEASFRKNEFISGMAILEWRTGKVMFRKSARLQEGPDNFWHQLIRSLSLMMDEDGNLVFTLNDDEAIRIPREKASGPGWNEARAVRIRAHPSQKSQRAAGNEKGRIKAYGKVIVRDYGDFVRVEKRTWVAD